VPHGYLSENEGGMDDEEAVSINTQGGLYHLWQNLFLKNLIEIFVSFKKSSSSFICPNCSLLDA